VIKAAMDPLKFKPQGIDDQAAMLNQFCLDQAPIAFFRHDADGRFLNANRKLTGILDTVSRNCAG